MRIAMAINVTTYVETGRPIRSATQAPNGNVGMINQLARLPMALAMLWSVGLFFLYYEH
jgi:hypothetical protein